jgi:hypothetical protein
MVKRMKAVLRLNKLWGSDGRLGVGRSTFLRDFVLHSKNDPFIPNSSSVRRLHLIELGPRLLGAFEEDVDAMIDALREDRDQKPIPKRPNNLPPSTRRGGRKQKDRLKGESAHG